MSLRQIQKGIRELFLPTRLLVGPFMFLFCIVRSDIYIRLFGVLFWLFPMSFVMITDALKGNRERCLWILLKSWQGQLILILTYSLVQFFALISIFTILQNRDDLCHWNGMVVDFNFWIPFGVIFNFYIDSYLVLLIYKMEAIYGAIGTFWVCACKLYMHMLGYDTLHNLWLSVTTINILCQLQFQVV